MLGEFRPRMRVPEKREGKPLSSRMRIAAELLAPEARRLMRYFADQVQKMEDTAGPIHTASFWTGIVLGFMAGALAAALLYGVTP